MVTSRQPSHLNESQSLAGLFIEFAQKYLRSTNGHMRTYRLYFTRQCAFITLAILIALGTPVSGLAQSGVATVNADATIYEDEPTENAGLDAEYCIGNLSATGDTRRAFIRFTLPGIPPGSLITRVEYDFTQNRVRQSCGANCEATFIMRRVTENWAEGNGSGPGSGPCGGGADVAGVNWNSQPAVGGVSASEALPGSNNTPINIDTDIGTNDDGLITDVQGWVDGTFSNFGWRLQVSEEGSINNARAMSPGSMTIHWTVPQNPSVMIEKTGTLDTGMNGQADPGDLINYTFTVTNNGDVALTDVSLNDPLVASINCPGGNPIPDLAPAQMEVCTGSYGITQNDIDSGQVNNTVAVTAQCTAGCPVMDNAQHSEVIPQTPLIGADKSGMLDPGGNGLPDPGDVINYSITVSNTGNVTLNTVSVTDPLVAVVSCPGGNPIPTLAPNTMQICTASYAITQNDIDAEQVDNTATVTGQCPTGCPVMGTAMHSEPITPRLNFDDGFEDLAPPIH